jgi:Trk-type K+ transport system membrane component
VHVASCSLKAFWFFYSVLKSPEKNIKKQQKQKNKNKRQKIARDNIEGALFVFFLFFCAVVLCDYLGIQARVSSIEPTTSILPPLNHFSTCFLR